MSTERLRTALADRYRIERELGQGGMATVYLAHDLRHQRDVAIKVLHPDLGAALGGERFLSEIRTTARLQHPHILPLLDSGEADGLLYYVMPLVNGETLRARLERERQLPIDDAVRIAREVADALGHAHGLGVIHRDIKPENILLQGGHALVADFGIALAVQTAGGQRMTQTGLSLGTPQYMSPEQAMGERAIDARSDIYALGVLTYEMLAGDPPFIGSSVQAVVAQLITDEPRGLTARRKAVPEHVESAVLRALEKLPADRFATATEFAAALSCTSENADKISRPRHAVRKPAIGRSRWRDPVVVVLGASTVASLAWALVTALRSAPPLEQVVSFTVPSFETGSTVLQYASFAISRDGQQLVYLARGEGERQALAVRRVDDATERLLEGTEDASHPIFSPDGASIAFVRGNQLFKVSTKGGPPQSLGMAPGTFNSMSWRANGTIIVSNDTSLLALPDVGGQPVVLVRKDAAAGEFALDAPLVWDEAAVVLYGSWLGLDISSARIAIAPLDGGPKTILDLPGIQPVGVIDGVLVYVNGVGTLMGVPIDIDRRRLTGVPVQLLPEVRFNRVTGIARAVMSRTGTLVYERGTQQSVVVLAGPDAKRDVVLAEHRDYAHPRLAPDGTTLAVAVGVGGRRDIWLHDLRSGTPTRLTTDGATNERPEWHPDGKRVLYRSNRNGRASIWWRNADMSRDAEPLLTGPRLSIFEAVVSPDRVHIAFQVDTLGADLYYRQLEGDTAVRPIAANPDAFETMPRISPDGKWIAFVTDESGEEAVVVQPFPGPGGRTQVSVAAATQPVWSRDGGRLIYRSEGWFIAARVQGTPTFAVRARDTLFRDDFVQSAGPHANYDVSPDGRLVVLQATAEGDRIVITNWRKALREAMQPPRHADD